MQSEADVKREVKNILKAHQPDVWWYMPVQTGYGVKGIPDFVCCVRGRLLGIETKFGSNTESVWQKKQGAAIREAGGEYFVINEENLYTLNAIIEALLALNPNRRK